MLNTNQIYHGDCLDILVDIDDNSIDAILTDPPYGINLKPQRSTSKFKNTKVINDDNLDWLPTLLCEYSRVLKPNSVGFMFCNWQNYEVFKKEIEKHFTIKNCLVWHKMWFGMGNNWRPDHEFILLFTNGKFTTQSKNKSNVLQYRRVAPQKLQHSCEKPVALLEELILESTDKEAVILDSFLGSGPTALACINTNRNYIGIEKDKFFVDLANKRISSVLQKK